MKKYKVYFMYNYKLDSCFIESLSFFEIYAAMANRFNTTKISNIVEC